MNEAIYKSNISRHRNNVAEFGKLKICSTVAFFATVLEEGRISCCRKCNNLQKQAILTFYMSGSSCCIFCNNHNVPQSGTQGKGLRTIKRHLAKMPHIVYVGSGYSGHWEVRQRQQETGDSSNDKKD